MPLYIAKNGDLDRCYRCLTHSQTLKDRSTQLLINCESGALETQYTIQYLAEQEPKSLPTLTATARRRKLPPIAKKAPA